MPLEVGDRAPDLTLKDQNNQRWTLSKLHGDRNVLLVFYPLAFSGICTGELDKLREDLTEYQNFNVQVLGVSVDSVFTLKAWSAKQGYDFPLLSDFWPHGTAAQAYGVFNERAGVAHRATFLIDTDGVIRFAEMNGPGEPRDQTVWKKALATLPS
ncbi:MAG: peroxiredoxin [Pseudonocardiaceae bacterium]